MPQLITKFSILPFQDAMKCADDILQFLCKWVVDYCGDDLDFISKRIDQTIIDRLKSIAGMSSEKITYTDAVNVLKEVIQQNYVQFKVQPCGILVSNMLTIFLNQEKHKLVPKIEWGNPLTEEHERYAYIYSSSSMFGFKIDSINTVHNINSYLAEEIYEKPVIIYNYPTKLKPFYARINDDAKTVAAFDMVVPKVIILNP